LAGAAIAAIRASAAAVRSFSSSRRSKNESSAANSSTGSAGNASLAVSMQRHQRLESTSLIATPAFGQCPPDPPRLSAPLG
jgi:hypothetical protein